VTLTVHSRYLIDTDFSIVQKSHAMFAIGKRHVF